MVDVLDYQSRATQWMDRTRHYQAQESAPNWAPAEQGELLMNYAHLIYWRKDRRRVEELVHAETGLIITTIKRIDHWWEAETWDFKGSWYDSRHMARRAAEKWALSNKYIIPPSQS